MINLKKQQIRINKIGKTQIYLALSIITIYTSACNHPNVVFEKQQLRGDIIYIKKTFDKKGDILIEEMLNKDTIKNGYYKEFNKGYLMLSGKYELGKKNGTWYHLDFRGDTIKVANWFEDKQFGEQRNYYMRTEVNKTPQLYKYAFNDLAGKELFSEKFDINGKITSFNGVPLYCAFNSKELKKGDIFELMCFFGIPPGCKYYLLIEEMSSEPGKVLYRNNYTDSLSDKIINLPFAKKSFVEKRYFDKGVFRWKLEFTVIDSTKGIICNDSTILIVQVN